MRKPILILSLLMLFLAAGAREKTALIPYPTSVQFVHDDAFVLDKNTVICAQPDLANEAAYLNERLKNRIGFSLKDADTSNSAQKIELKLDKSLADNAEHYTLHITKDCIAICGSTPKAVFCAIQTLDQWLIGNASVNTDSTVVDLVHIDDCPRFGYRALMLDPARHFLTADEVKRFIDEMVRYKFNVLQMHLADDQGWRIEIKSQPELTSSCEHYSTEEIKDLIDYAQKRHVEIVPEIDIPGHTFALLKEHKELCCDIVDTSDFADTTRTDVMLCASQEGVYRIVANILTEICSLFPSQYIHLGGDESLIEKNWGKCTHCQRLKRSLGYESNDQIMGYFFSHFWELLDSYGKKPVLWMEMDNVREPAHRYLFDYPKNVTLVTWRYGLTPKAIQLSGKAGNNLIMAPGEHCYFDYPQYKNDLPETNNWGMPILTLKDAYCWNPVYPELSLPSSHIQGVMGTLWGEAIIDIDRAFYMAYPRSMALAEAGWSKDKGHADFQDFLSRLQLVLADMIGRGVPFRVPFEAYRK